MKAHCRPLANLSEADLLNTTARILAKPGFSREDYQELMEINWEMMMRELLAAKPDARFGLINRRPQ